MIPALRRQKQVDLSEFKVNLVYKVSSRRARAVTRPKKKKKNRV